MISITGLSRERYIELVQTASKKGYRYSSSIYYDEIRGYDIIFTPEISAYITSSYEHNSSKIELLALGQHFITINPTDYSIFTIG